MADTLADYLESMYDPSPARIALRPGFEVIAKMPSIVKKLHYIEGGKKLIAVTGRGAFWIRMGKKPRRISA